MNVVSKGREEVTRRNGKREGGQRVKVRGGRKGGGGGGGGGGAGMREEREE